MEEAGNTGACRGADRRACGMEEAERFSVPDDLKDKIMKKIEKQNN